jgi:hypothetical protein
MMIEFIVFRAAVIAVRWSSFRSASRVPQESTVETLSYREITISDYTSEKNRNRYRFPKRRNYLGR